MSDTDANEPRRPSSLEMVPLNSSPHEHEYWDVRRGVIHLVRHPEGRTTAVSERPIGDGDRWKLSAIADTIDRELFG